MKASAVLLVGLLGFACTSRSPFSRPPAAVAIAEPCRFMGTLHKESRQRIEILRACHDVSYEEWACMARALERLDTEFTGFCTERRVLYSEIAHRQRLLYGDCLQQRNDELVECSLLSTDPRCLTKRCSRPGRPQRSSAEISGVDDPAGSRIQSSCIPCVQCRTIVPPTPRTAGGEVNTARPAR